MRSQPRQVFLPDSRAAAYRVIAIALPRRRRSVWRLLFDLFRGR